MSDPTRSVGKRCEQLAKSDPELVEFIAKTAVTAAIAEVEEMLLGLRTAALDRAVFAEAILSA